MKITDALNGEHGVLYAQFDWMEKSAPTAPLNAIQAQGALLASALATHAHLENEILFPAIEAEIGEGGPTQVMRAEHAHIENLLAQLQTLRELTQAHDEIAEKLARIAEASDVELARAWIRDLIFAAREHFAREETILFPMAEQLLGEHALHALGARWAERRGVTLSAE